MKPEVGKVYNYFDDGKIKESRRMPVVVTEIIPFNEVGSDILKLWEEEVKWCDWLYAPTTDCFIKANLQLSDRTEVIYFVRTHSDGWFSLGDWGGRLDVDGELNTSLVSHSKSLLNEK